MENHNVPPIFILLVLFCMGVLFLLAPPEFIRGYDEIKHDPKKVRKLMRTKKTIATLLTIGGSIGIIMELLRWIF